MVVVQVVAVWSSGGAGKESTAHENECNCSFSMVVHHGRVVNGIGC